MIDLCIDFLFSHTSGVAPGMAMTICQSVGHPTSLVQTTTIYTTIRWIAMKFRTDIYVFRE